MLSESAEGEAGLGMGATSSSPTRGRTRRSVLGRHDNSLSAQLRSEEGDGSNIVAMLKEVKASRELEAVLRCFVPGLIEERVSGGMGGMWVSEHRKLVSVFMKVNGLGLKPCEVADLHTAHKATQIVQQHVQKHDGTITRLICDDKGTRFLIAFGLPGHANEDDESRAVLACLRIVEELETIEPVLPSSGGDADEDAAPPSLGISVGITTGRVFCGEAGSEGTRVEYTLSGARVNLAARLMQAAGKTEEKGVLCDVDTYEACGSGLCSWEALTPIKVKGKEELVPIFRPRLVSNNNTRKTYRAPDMQRGSSSDSANARSSAETANDAASGGLHARRLKRTLGRKDEQQLLHSGLKELSGGKGGAILLLGEAGMGKTHLVDVLRAMHEREERNTASSTSTSTEDDDEPSTPIDEYEGHQVGLFVNASKPIEATTPFFMWKGVFEKLFTTRTLKRVEAKTRRVKGAAAPPAEHHAPEAEKKDKEKRRGSNAPDKEGASGSADKPAEKAPVKKTHNVAVWQAAAKALAHDSGLKQRPSHSQGGGGGSSSGSSSGGGGGGGASGVSQEAVAVFEASSRAPGGERTTGGERVTFALGGETEAAPAEEKPAELTQQGSFKRTGSHSSLDVAKRMSRRASAYVGNGMAGRKSFGDRLDGKREEPNEPSTSTSGNGTKPTLPGGGSFMGNLTSMFDGKPSASEQRRAAWRQKWRDAYSSVLAFQLPSYVLDGRHSIRPSADDLLLNDDQFIDLAPLLSPVLPLNIKDNEVTKHLTGEARMNATINLIVRVLAAKLGHGRSVVVFEDVHWMDSSSWAVLRAALKEVRPLLVLLTSRPLPQKTRPAAYDDIVSHHLACKGAVCELPGLQEAEIRALICENMGVDDIQQEFMHLLAEKSNGNPFWALEFVRSMRDSGIIAVRGNKCELMVGMDQVEFPSSVEALITSRMDRLPPQEQLHMKMASIMGMNFSTDELGFLAEQLMPEPIKDQVLVGQLDRLCEAEMLQRDASGKAGDYSFKHKYLQDVSYSLLAEELKEKLHRAAAEYYEGFRKLGRLPGKGKTGSGGGGKKLAKLLMDTGGRDERTSNGVDQELIWKLQHHWYRAGDDNESTSRAVRYLTLAGDAALDNFSLAEAKELLTKALTKAMSTPACTAQRGPLQRRMAQCHHGVGELSDCRTALTAALVSLGGEKDHRTYEGLSEAEFGGRYWRQRMQYKIFLFLRQAQGKGNSSKVQNKKQLQKGPAPKEGEKRPQRIELAIAYELLAQVSMMEHQREQAGYCAMRALHLGQSLPTLTPVVARAYASLCLVESAAEKSSSWMVARYKRKALETCEQLGELGQLGYTLLAAGVLDAGQARWTNARDNLGRAAAIYEQLKNKKQWEVLICHQAHVEFYHGSFAESKALYEDAATSARLRGGDKQTINTCNAGIAGNLLATNDIAGAMAILKNTNSWGQLALALLRSGKREEALEKALLVKDRFKGKRTKYYVLKAYASTAEVILKLLEDAIARREGRAVAVSGKKDAKSERLTMGSSMLFATTSSREASKGSSGAGLLRVSGASEDDDGAAARLDDPNSLSQMAEEWSEKLEQFGNIYLVAKPRALLLQGQLQVLGNETKRKLGLQSFKNSLAFARQLAMPYDEALALYELGKHADQNHQQALKVRHLQNAQDIFEKVGAEFDVQRCKLQLQRARGRLSTMGLPDEGSRLRAPSAADLESFRELEQEVAGEQPQDEAEDDDGDEEEEDDDGEDTWRHVGASHTQDKKRSSGAAVLSSVAEAAPAVTAAPRASRSNNAASQPAESGAPAASTQHLAPAAARTSQAAAAAPAPASANRKAGKSTKPALPGLASSAGSASRRDSRQRSASSRSASAEGCSMGCGAEPHSAEGQHRPHLPASARAASDPMRGNRSPAESTSASDRSHVTFAGRVAPARVEGKPRAVSPIDEAFAA